MSALVPPEDAPLPRTSGDIDSVLITQLEAQQTRIAQELHDALGSRLAAIAMMLGAIKTTQPQHNASHEALDRVIAHTQAAAQVVRKLARGLMPVDATPGALWRLLEQLCADYDRIQGLRCEFAMRGDFDDLPAEAANHLYRIAQEALTNAWRSGQATHVTLTLMRYTGYSEIRVSDNGVGYTPASAAPPAGLGLRSMRARSALIGGYLSIQSSLPSGTALTVRWPTPTQNV